jgi:hypothetical protein
MTLKLTDHATHDLGGGGFFRMGKETNHRSGWLSSATGIRFRCLKLMKYVLS